MSTTEKHFLTLCENGAIDEIRSILVNKVVRADYEHYEEGTWGAHMRISPIHIAIRKKNLELIKLLLHYEANVNAKHSEYDWRGCGHVETAFEAALGMCFHDRNNADLLKEFLKYKADPNLLATNAVHTMRTDGKSTYTPLHTAVKFLHVPCVQALLEAGAEVNKEYRSILHNEYGRRENTTKTPLHIAIEVDFTSKSLEPNEVEKCREKIITYLIDANADVNYYKSFTQQNTIEKSEKAKGITDPREPGYESGLENVKVKATPLHIAIRCERYGVIRQLLSRGARIDIPYVYGKDIISTMDLVETFPEKRELKKALVGKWSPEVHKYQSVEDQTAIKTFLLCDLRLEWNLPREIIFLIFEKLCETQNL